MWRVTTDSKSEKSAIGMLAPAKLEKPMNQMRCGRTGRRASMQSIRVSHDVLLCDERIYSLDQ
jgi:hypothetical protein